MKRSEKFFRWILDAVFMTIDSTPTLAVLCVGIFTDIPSMSDETKAVLWGMLFIILAIDRLRGTVQGLER